jgi:predicted ribonuclease YlaK
MCIDIFSITKDICQEAKNLKNLKVRKPDLESALRDKTYEKVLNCLDYDNIEIVSSCEKFVTFNKAKAKLFPDKYEYFANLKIKRKQEYFGYKEIYLSEYPEDIVESLLSEIYTQSSNREKLNLNKQIVKDFFNIELVHNEYLIIWVDENSSIVYKNTAGNQYRLVEHTSIPYSFKVKDVYQKIAYDSCINPDVATIIDGPVGSGKTLIALLSALKNMNSYKQIFVIRPNIGIDPRFDIGFLPGDLDDKLLPWIGGIITNLSYILRDEKKAETIINSYIRHIPLNMIQGYSIHNSIVIVDESQFLSLDLIKQIVSRISEGSKLIMLYDEKQSYGIADYIGLKKILESLPNPLFSYVRLKNIYRSKYADYAEKL